jgi:hypothetical protein
MLVSLSIHYNINDEIEFNTLKKSIQNKNISSDIEYINYATTNNLCIEPHIKFHIYWKTWYEFLNININIFPDFNEWKQICITNKINSTNYNKKASKYNLPLMPNEVYKNFTNLQSILDITKTKQRKN